MASAAQWERDVIGLRQGGARGCQAKGVSIGRPNGENPAVRHRIGRLGTAGHSYRAIADRLDSDSILLPGGGIRWWGDSVRLVDSGSQPRPMCLCVYR